MLQLHLPLQNERTVPIRICLEPTCDYFIVQPGQKIEVHALIDEETENLTFTVAPGDDVLSIYCPGELLGLIDCFVISDGERLESEVD